MPEGPRIALATVLVVAGVVLCGYVAYRQYVSLPEERTARRSGGRVGLAVLGVALVFLGSRLLP